LHIDGTATPKRCGQTSEEPGQTYTVIKLPYTVVEKEFYKEYEGGMQQIVNDQYPVNHTFASFHISLLHIHKRERRAKSAPLRYYWNQSFHGRGRRMYSLGRQPSSGSRCSRAEDFVFDVRVLRAEGF
jgi:hypothetical protein